MDKWLLTILSIAGGVVIISWFAKTADTSSKALSFEMERARWKNKVAVQATGWKTAKNENQSLRTKVKNLTEQVERLRDEVKALKTQLGEQGLKEKTKTDQSDKR